MPWVKNTASAVRYEQMPLSDHFVATRMFGERPLGSRPTSGPISQ